MDRTKPVVTTCEFLRRLWQREIISAFESHEACVRAIEEAISKTGLIMPHPEKGAPDYWCLFEIEGLGLVKVPCFEESNAIIAVTIAHPVTDPRCREAYLNFVRAEGNQLNSGK